jgi:hypothetical protein
MAAGSGPISPTGKCRGDMSVRDTQRVHTVEQVCDALVVRALGLDVLGQYEEAIQDVHSALRLHPSHVRAMELADRIAAASS